MAERERARVRDNQRRSIARKKEHTRQIEDSLQLCVLQEVEASAKARHAIRQVTDENARLRGLLEAVGLSSKEVESSLASDRRRGRDGSGEALSIGVRGDRCAADAASSWPGVTPTPPPGLYAASSSVAIPMKPGPDLRGAGWRDHIPGAGGAEPPVTTYDDLDEQMPVPLADGRDTEAHRFEYANDHAADAARSGVQGRRDQGFSEPRATFDSRHLMR